MRRLLENNRWSLAVAAALALSLAGAGASYSSMIQNQQTLEQLRDIQVGAVQIVDHAATLRSMTDHLGTYELSAHEFELNRIRNRVNEIGELVPKIQSKTDTPEWQREIVDEVASLLAAMSAQADAAIQLVNESTTVVELNTNAYDARLIGIRHYAEHINELVEFADTRTEVMRKEAYSS